MIHPESHTARTARERLEAIKKFLPVKDSFRKNLQAQQEARVEYEEDTKKLFKPVTAATEKVATVIKEDLLPVSEK